MIENGRMETFHCGCKRWFDKKMKYHRLDGPTFDTRPSCIYDRHRNMAGAYFIHGEELTKEEHAKRVKEIEQEALKEIEQLLAKCYAWLIVHRSHDCWGEPSARLTLLLSSYHTLIDEPTTYGVFEHAQDVLLETIMKRKVK